MSHAAPGLPLATISNCIDRSASRLLGQEGHGPGSYQSWTAKGLDGFAECPVLTPEALQEAREAFEKRESGRYERMAPFVGRLAQALGCGRMTDRRGGGAGGCSGSEQDEVRRREGVGRYGA